MVWIATKLAKKGNTYNKGVLTYDLTIFFIPKWGLESDTSVIS